MKFSTILLVLALSFLRLYSLSPIFEEKIKIYSHEDIKFYIGNVPFDSKDSPNFNAIPEYSWKNLDDYRYNAISDKTKIWFKIDLSGIIIPFNAVYFHSLQNNLTLFYPYQVFPTRDLQADISNYNINSHMNKQIIPLEYNSIIPEFTQNTIFFSIDINQKTPLFKFFPVLVGDESAIREFIINEEIIKRNTDYFTFFIGNFLLFVSTITLLFFCIRIKVINYTLLFFSLLMGTAGIFYWMLSPLSLFFSDFTFSRMLYILTLYHLIWFFFGLLITSFLKIKAMASFSLLICINLLLLLISPKSISLTKFITPSLLFIYNFIIIYQLHKSKLDLLNTKLLFSTAASLNAIFLISPIFLPNKNPITLFSHIGLGLLVWIIAFAIYTYKQYLTTINELQLQKIKNLQLTESILESQLSSLKKQLDPHFLFNSLGTLIALIEIDKDSAIDYIQEFSNVYRYILQTQDQNFVTLKDELNFCKAFIFLLKKRFDKAIIISQNIQTADLDKFLPPLSVQMLIENAIKHNIATQEKALSIKIFTQDDFIVVENNLQLKKHDIATPKLGLKNLNQRLFLLKQINIVILETDSHFIAKIPILREV